MASDPARASEVRAWLQKSATDLRASEHDCRSEPPLLEDALFHVQQAVEKILKGFLTWHDLAFRKTHDLVELGQQCVQLDASLEPLLRHAAPLTEYAWKFRYPGEPDEPTLEEVHEALATARAVWDAVTSRLPNEAVPQ